MPRQSGSGWFMQYESSKVETRLLISLPRPMADDLHAIAAAQKLSSAEVIRRALTRHMRDFVREHPTVVALKGSAKGP